MVHHIKSRLFNLPLRHYRFSQGQNCCRFLSVKADKQDRLLKVMFFGNDDFSIATLKKLHEAMSRGKVISHLEVCTSESKSLISPVVEFCQKNEVKQHKWPPPSAPDDNRFDLGIVASFGKLLTKEVINSFPLGVLNVHGSLLPKWRGASPISHALMAGDTETGISIMEILPYHFDIGRVFAQKSVHIHPDEIRNELLKNMAVVGAELMLQVIKDFDSYCNKAWKQDESLVSYAPKLDKSLFEVDWKALSARQVYNRWRGLSGLSKLHSTWQDTGETILFDGGVNPSVISALKIEINGGKNCNASMLQEQDFSPGRVVYVKRGKNRFLCIKCAEGWVGFNRLYVGTRKVMTPVDFFNGYISRFRHKQQYFCHR